MSTPHINRSIEEEFRNKVKPNRVLLLHGARRVGKTELLKKYLSEQEASTYLLLNGEDQTAVRLMEERSIENYKRLIGDRKLLVIDEAQKIKEVGLKLKLIVDEIPNIKVIATGSSVFDLDNKLGEPLVGRKHTIRLYPLAQMELSQQETIFDTHAQLDDRLIFGGYPELLQYPNREDKIDYLNEIRDSYLLRDILEFEGIRKADKVMDLLRMIAFQVGKEVKLDELGGALRISKNTVERYLDLLSKVFVIYKVSGYSRNLRKEITKMDRWYFYDNGIRNAVIQNFNSLDMRADKGDLWENYLVSERLKYQSYKKLRTNNYFWRTYDQQELDWVEERAGELSGYEFKYSPTKKAKVPGGWARAYPEASFQVVNSGNFLDFIT